MAASGERLLAAAVQAAIRAKAPRRTVAATAAAIVGVLTSATARAGAPNAPSGHPELAVTQSQPPSAVVSASASTSLEEQVEALRVLRKMKRGGKQQRKRARRKAKKAEESLRGGRGKDTTAAASEAKQRKALDTAREPRARKLHEQGQPQKEAASRADSKERRRDRLAEDRLRRQRRKKDGNDESDTDTDISANQSWENMTEDLRLVRKVKDLRERWEELLRKLNTKGWNVVGDMDDLKGVMASVAEEAPSQEHRDGMKRLLEEVQVIEGWTMAERKTIVQKEAVTEHVSKLQAAMDYLIKTAHNKVLKNEDELEKDEERLEGSLAWGDDKRKLLAAIMERRAHWAEAPRGAGYEEKRAMLKHARKMMKNLNGEEEMTRRDEKALKAFEDFKEAMSKKTTAAASEEADKEAADVPLVPMEWNSSDEERALKETA